MWDGLEDTYCLLAGYRREYLRIEQYKNKPVRWGVIFLTLLTSMLMLGSAYAQEGPCRPPECYEETPEPPKPPRPPSDAPESHHDSPGPQWPGYEDGRLNPDPAEYYTIFCSDGFIHVRVVLPAPAEVNTIPLYSVASISAGNSIDIGHFMSLVRNTEDTITIYGSNGNGPTHPGQKAFSLLECVAADGTISEEQLAAYASVTSPPVTISDGCEGSRGFGYLLCVSEDPETALEFLFWLAFQICYPIALVIPFGFTLHFRRRRRK